MFIIVTGSRDFKDRQLVWRTLDELLADCDSLTVRHGACWTGADAMAKAWAQARARQQLDQEVEEKGYPAAWSVHGDAAGPIRNTGMVNLRPLADLCVAFYQPGAANIGTADCVRKARTAGIEVRSFNEPGRLLRGRRLLASTEEHPALF